MDNSPITIGTLFDAADLSLNFLPKPLLSVVDGIGFKSPLFEFVDGDVEIKSAIEIMGWSDSPFTVVFAHGQV